MVFGHGKRPVAVGLSSSVVGQKGVSASVLRINTFPPFRRIRARPAFNATFRCGKRLYSAYYILYYYRNDINYARMGVITSKRSLKKAVRRNCVKRMARETFRLSQQRMKPVDIVLVAQKKADRASKKELKRCLEKLFKKALFY